MTTLQQQIATQVLDLPGEQVKTLVLSWLSQTSGTLPDFQQMLEVGTPSPVADLEYGEFDETLQFQPLTEAQQIQQSLETLAEYRRTKDGVPHAQVREWLNSIGTEREIECPQ
jgi:hypothetical protein